MLFLKRVGPKISHTLSMEISAFLNPSDDSDISATNILPQSNNYAPLFFSNFRFRFSSESSQTSFVMYPRDMSATIGLQEQGPYNRIDACFLVQYRAL